MIAGISKSSLTLKIIVPYLYSFYKWSVVHRKFYLITRLLNRASSAQMIDFE